MHASITQKAADEPAGTRAAENIKRSAMSLPAVVVIGRPNVGKSTFFNRVVGGRPAIVDSQPGVTRDVRYAEAEWAGRRFVVLDTGGIVEEVSGEIEAAVRRQAQAAMESADLIVFMVDGREGIHPLDQYVAGLLRKRSRPVLLVVNKLDSLPETTDHLEFYALGLGDPVPLSAVSGRGSGDLLDRIVEMLPRTPVAAALEESALLRLAVIGRPNVGKSSFINKILGEERLVVSEDAGTTRDPIDTPFEKDGRQFLFIDTAGLRRKSRVESGLEYYAVLRTLRTIDRSDVCLLIVDAVEGVGNQDFRIARLAWEHGCGLVMAVNKWDLVDKDTNTAQRMEKALQERLPFLSAVPIVFTSALTGQRVRRALDLAWQVGQDRAREITTSELNKALQALTAAVPPPQRRGRPLKFYYATQVGARPPTFALWTNYPKDIPKAYARYLANGFRKQWGFLGTPIRLKLRARRRERG